VPKVAAALALAGLGLVAPLAAAPPARPPNVVIILADDMGWGDLGVFGNPTIRTPRLDRMAAEGQKWTSFYVGESVCTPSRAALLTGRLAIRSGLNPVDDDERVFYPDSTGGLPASEITIAEILRTRGYATTAIGKWHLGHLPPFLPMAHGFDHYFGIPYSNDMDMIAIPGASFGGEDPKKRDRMMDPRLEYWNVPLMRDDRVAARPADQSSITRRYTEEATRFIRENASRPFFLYLAHTMPHMPLFASPPFAGRSRRGRYGDVIEEIDWRRGPGAGHAARALSRRRDPDRVLQRQRALVALRRARRIRGPAARGQGRDLRGRDARAHDLPVAGPRGARGGGGHGRDHGPAAHPVRAGGRARAPRPDPGRRRPQRRPAPLGTEPAPGRLLLPRAEGLRPPAWAVQGALLTKSEYGPDPEVAHDPPLLFNLDEDPGESFDVAARHPDIIAALRRIAAEHARTLVPVENQLTKRASP